MISSHTLTHLERGTFCRFFFKIDPDKGTKRASRQLRFGKIFFPVFNRKPRLPIGSFCGINLTFASFYLFFGCTFGVPQNGFREGGSDKSGSSFLLGKSFPSLSRCFVVHPLKVCLLLWTTSQSGEN